MGFITNIYLSRDFSLKMIGAFIEEGVKAESYQEYDHDIIEGITSNLQLKAFMRDHEAYKRSVSRLNAKYSKFSDDIIDLVYDHFLAKEWNRFSSIPLESFAQAANTTLSDHYQLMPYKMRRIAVAIVNRNMFLKMQSIDGIHYFIKNMIKRSTFQSTIEYAISDLIQNYGYFKKDFIEVFEAMVKESNHLKSTDTIAVSEKQEEVFVKVA